MKTNLNQLALRYHQRLPEHLWGVLRSQGIGDIHVHTRLLGWDGTHLTVPVVDEDRRVLFLEYWRVGDGCLSPDRLRNLGNPVELYGYEALKWRASRILFAENALERLVLDNEAFGAVASTGEDFSFREEWVPHFESFERVFVVPRRRVENLKVAERMAEQVPQVRVVALPEAVGEGGGAWDFFVRLKRSAAEFKELLSEAESRHYGF